MAMIEDTPMAPAAAPTEAAAAPATAGFTICIDCLPDGSFAVSSEPLEAETGEMGEPAGQKVATIGEALKAAVMLYQNQGSTGEGEFEAGYSGGKAGAAAGAGAEETAPLEGAM